jgi:hypothetical protein
LIVWFPPDDEAVVVVVLGVNKARMGDVSTTASGSALMPLSSSG